MVPPDMMAFLRWVVACALLTPFLLPKVWAYRRELRVLWPRLAFLGFIGMALFQGLAYYAAKSMSATSIGIFVAFVPLLTIGFSAILLREPPRPLAILGCVISLLGVVWLVSRGEPVTLITAGLGQGELFMLVASISYAAYNVLLRRWAMPIPSWVSIYAQACFALLFLMPGWLLHESQPLSWGGWGLILYAGILPSIFGP